MYKLLLLTSAFIGTVLSYNPGITGSMDTVLIENHKKFLANFIISKLNTVHIPDITIVSGNLTVALLNNTYQIQYTVEDQI